MSNLSENPRPVLGSTDLRLQSPHRALKTHQPYLRVSLLALGGGGGGGGGGGDGGYQ